MLIENSLLQFLGIYQRTLNSNLKKMGWTAIKSDNIDYRSLVSYSATRIFIEALRHQMMIHVRVFTKSTWAPTTAEGREVVLRSGPQTSDLSLAMMYEMLAGTESALGPMELDKDLVAHVTADSIEDADESPEFVNSKIDSLRQTIAGVGKALATKTRDFKMQTLKLARVCRLVKQRQLEITELISRISTASDQIVSPVPKEEFSSTTQDDIPHMLRKELFQLVDVADHPRSKTDAMCHFAYAPHAINPETYGFARQALLLPTPTTIVNHALNETWYVRNAVDGRGGVPLSMYLQDYRKRENICPDAMVQRFSVSMLPW
jgi:hypothetical protein